MALVIRVRRHMQARRMWAIAAPVDRLARRHAACKQRAAMVAALEDYDIGFCNRVARKLHRCFDRLGARGDEQERVQAAASGHRLLEVASEFEHRLVVCDVDLRMPNLVDLRVHCLLDLGVTMPEARHADACGEIQILLSRRRPHPSAFASVQDHVRHPADTCTDVHSFLWRCTIASGVRQPASRRNNEVGRTGPWTSCATMRGRENGMTKAPGRYHDARWTNETRA
mmetsp:Transcript_77009/g.214131  ORF Transcript_77009/g.214131 Transcript_77009/m.214131 type:complete len:227 (+) Transcript_77009:849-1529(+)